MAALALQLFMTGDDDIIVDPDWRPHAGDPMPQMPGCFVGKRFGAGALSFNQIFDVVDKDGRPTEQAIKVCKPTRAAQRSLAHEWKMYKNLRLLGDEYPAAHSHFLQAQRVIKQSNGVIAGIVMEKASGHNVVKTLSNPRFCNVRYVIALLRDVLVGLDVAQRVLGFQHYDLKLDNIIEHYCGDAEAGRARVLIDAVPQFKIFDLGTAVVYPDPFSLHAAVNDHLQRQHPEGASVLAEQRSTSRGAVVDRNTGEPLYEYSAPFWCVRFYHLWGKGKGDVFRVLCALCRLLDNRTWPLEDLELVSLLMTVLERATNSRRLRVRFAPRALLLRKLYGGSGQAGAAAAAGHGEGPHSAGVVEGGVGGRAGAGAAPIAGSSSSMGLSKLSQALLQQHAQLVLQPSRALTGNISQLLPQGAAAAAIAATAAADRTPSAQNGRPQGQQQQQQAGLKKEEAPAAAPSPLLSPVSSVTEASPFAAAAAQSRTPAAPAAAAAAAPTASQPAPPQLTIVTGAGGLGGRGSELPPIPASPLGGDAAGSSNNSGGTGRRTPRRSIDTPASPFAVAGGGGSSTGGGGTGGGGGQYTPRRSTEVPREEFLVATTASGRLESSLPGVSFVRLTKAPPGSQGGPAGAAGAAADAAVAGGAAQDPAGVAGAGAGAGSASGGGGPGAAGAPAGARGMVGDQGGVVTDSAAEQAGAGSRNSNVGEGPSAAAAGPGMLLQMVVPGQQQCKRQLASFNAVLLQQQQQRASVERHAAGGSAASHAPGAAAAAGVSSSAAAPARARAAAAEPAWTRSSAAASAHVPPQLGARVSEEDEETGEREEQQREQQEGSVHTPGKERADDPHFCRLDNAAAVVAHQPVAMPAQQSVLGNRKALRGVTAQQLLVEPVVQSLLSKV